MGYLCSSGPRLGWSAFRPSSCRGYGRMDRSLDTAAWENFSHKPDLIHLSRWQPEAHQASSWLFAASKRLTPMTSSLTSLALAGASVLLKTAQWARHIPRGPDCHEQSPAPAGAQEIQTPGSERKTGGPGCASPSCFQNHILLETNNKAKTFICLVLLGEPETGHKAQFHMS